MKRLLLLSLFLFSALGFLPGKAYADCQTVYGGGQTCTYSSFSLQKFVQIPGQSNFVSNLYSDRPFALSQTVNFQIVVVNTGTQNLSSVTLVDTFPQFISFVSGPGSFNTSNNTLTFVANNLNIGQSQTFNVSGKIASSGIPQGTPCVMNQVTGTDNNGDTNAASSWFCIQNVVNPTPTPTVVPTPTPAVLPVTQVKTTPPTGPEMLPLMLLFPGALGGLYLRRKSKKTMTEGGEK
jgi:uncharacterized repeat protein (TIGR01451 family)